MVLRRDSETGSRNGDTLGILKLPKEPEEELAPGKTGTRGGPRTPEPPGLPDLSTRWLPSLAFPMRLERWPLTDSKLASSPLLD